MEPGPGTPGFERPSDKSYAKAVALSGIFGVFGLQHFYLGRHLSGLLDVGLSVAWIYCFATGRVGLGLLFAALDFSHALAVTILLLTGNFRDGEGHRVCYPGQRLGPQLRGRSPTAKGRTR